MFALLLSIAPALEPAAIPLEITIQFIGTEKPSSFPKQLYVHILNPGYSPVNLAQLMQASELIIDGKPSKWTGGFKGPPGLGPVNEWDGCIDATAFQPPITPGSHKVSMKVGTGQSSEIKMRWFEPLNWRAGNMKSRMKEVKALALVITDGMPQSCAEYWLNTKDGGVMEDDKVRYFFEPDLKMVVPYRQTFVGGKERTIVDGTPTVYKEAKLAD